MKDSEDLCRCSGLKSSICYLKSEKICNEKNCKEIIEPEFTYAKAECAFSSCKDSSFHFVDDVVFKTCGGGYNSAQRFTVTLEIMSLNCIDLYLLFLSTLLLLLQMKAYDML